jgi:hypothetical protein
MSGSDLHLIYATWPLANPLPRNQEKQSDPLAWAIGSLTNPHLSCEPGAISTFPNEYSGQRDFCSFLSIAFYYGAKENIIYAD